jgi:putative phosphoribosyl transferase
LQKEGDMGNMRLVSGSADPFENRFQAGGLLGQELLGLNLRAPLTLGIPRGGLVVGREVARVLGGDLDIVLARKLRAPYNPELAIGAITEDGTAFVDKRLSEVAGVTPAYLDDEERTQLAEIGQRLRRVRAVLSKSSLAGREVVVVDDGVATGATMQAALWAARREDPSRLICALPVAPEDTARRLAASCDELVALRSPADFAAVGQFYVRFEQTTDEEVLNILQNENKRRQAMAGGAG